MVLENMTLKGCSTRCDRRFLKGKTVEGKGRSHVFKWTAIILVHIRQITFQLVKCK